MSLRRHRTSIFLALGVAAVAGAVAMNIGWVVLNWRAGVQLVLGALLFAIVIAGVVLNTVFLLREIKRNEQHNNFINSVTHELKTPVASIRLYLETLKTRPVEEAKRQQFYDIMLEDSDRLLHTIEQVLKAGQVSAGRPSKPEPVNLAQVIEQSVSIARLRHRIADESLHFHNRVPTGVQPIVMGDEEDLRTAMLNLLDNAVKYSAEELQIEVELESGQRNDYLVRVRDQGIGIPKDELKSVFKRFHRIRNNATSRVKGTGLGLFIVHSVARRHNGRVHADSGGAGMGSTFTLHLPAAPGES